MTGRGRVDTAAPFYDLVLLVDRIVWARQMAGRAAAKIVLSPAVPAVDPVRGRDMTRPGRTASAGDGYLARPVLGAATNAVEDGT